MSAYSPLFGGAWRAVLDEIIAGEMLVQNMVPNPIPGHQILWLSPLQELLDMPQDTVQLIEAVIGQHQLALALGSVLDLHRRSQAL